MPNEYTFTVSEHEKNVLLSALGVGAVELSKNYQTKGLNAETIKTLTSVFHTLRTRLQALEAANVPTAPGARRIRCLEHGTVYPVGGYCPKCCDDPAPPAATVSGPMCNECSGFGRKSEFHDHKRITNTCAACGGTGYTKC